MAGPQIRLRIRNFKGIATGEIELGRISVLLGANNSGKSTVLEALFLAPNPFRYTAYGEPAAKILNFLHSGMGEGGYIFLMRNYGLGEAEIEALVGAARAAIEIVNESHDFPYLLVRQPDGEALGHLAKHSAKANSSTVSPSNKHGFEALYYHPLLRDLATKALANKWPSIQDAVRKVASSLSELVRMRLVTLTLEPFGSLGNLACYAMLEDGRKIRVSDLGDGIRTLIPLMLLYEAWSWVDGPRLLLIDDVECHMNPRALAVFSNWLADRLDEGAYLVLTTHSLGAAKYILARLEEHGAAAYLLGLRNGELKYKRLTLDDIEELKRAGLDVRVAEPYLL